MPLHDWADDRGFDSLHLVWQNQLLEWVQPRLPPEYRAYMGGVPSLSFDSPNGRPDLGVRNFGCSHEPVLGIEIDEYVQLVLRRDIVRDVAAG